MPSDGHVITAGGMVGVAMCDVLCNPRFDASAVAVTMKSHSDHVITHGPLGQSS